MDIAKYIGLFLLKNKYCCLQGLGNVAIKKTNAQHSNQEIKPGSYYATLDPVGAIDDAFPNFVANNEHVSIAKASNEVSEFIKESKAKLANGSAVIIPSVGQYVMKDHKLYFELDANFSLPTKPLPFPVAEVSKSSTVEVKSTDEPTFEAYNNYTKQRAVNWNIVAFWGLVILIGGGIIAWGVKYFMAQQNNTEMVVEQPINPEPIIAPNPVDTAVTAASNDSISSNSTNNNNPNDTPAVQFVIKTFNNLAKAQKKQKQLSSYGYNVSVLSKDSTTHYVIHSLKVMPTDTLRIKDSLTKLLNPSGVFILNN